MNPLTIVLPFRPELHTEQTLRQFADSPHVEEVMVVHDGSFTGSGNKCRGIKSSSFTSAEALNRIISIARTDYLLFVTHSEGLLLGRGSLERFIEVLKDTGCGMAYSDHYELKSGVRAEHPLLDYQFGSIRDNFDFGSLQCYSTRAIKNAVKNHGRILPAERTALYDLRLKVSADHQLFHIQEFLYTRLESDARRSGEKQFDYVDPRNRNVQKEMEEVATRHLKDVGAYLRPSFRPVPATKENYPAEASVIIPVRNRERTIKDAVESALRQKTDFPFNVVVVDNHSTDATTRILAEKAERDRRLKHVVPDRKDLGIGGCWNEAVGSQHCGRYAIQLDSDDVYINEDTIQKVVDVFRGGQYAMVIGSYKLVNMELEEIPPGLIDHKEWTPENGRNNALRINGLGAPRAFQTSLVRKNPLPNVSYGEDYAVALRLSREYQIGRIYDPLYLCRRWEGNTDAALPVDKVNRNDHYKDSIRTIEMRARQKLNAAAHKTRKK